MFPGPKLTKQRRGDLAGLRCSDRTSGRVQEESILPGLFSRVWQHLVSQNWVALLQEIIYKTRKQMHFSKFGATKKTRWDCGDVHEKVEDGHQR